MAFTNKKKIVCKTFFSLYLTLFLKKNFTLTHSYKNIHLIPRNNISVCKYFAHRRTLLHSNRALDDFLRVSVAIFKDVSSTGITGRIGATERDGKSAFIERCARSLRRRIEPMENHDRY